MHGEYKMPGGKLIVADIETRANTLDKVQISGDFFLEPPTALDRINQALQGLDIDSTNEAMAAAITAAMPDDVSMYGISADAVAVAVRRALETNA